MTDLTPERESRLTAFKSETGIEASTRLVASWKLPISVRHHPHNRRSTPQMRRLRPWGHLAVAWYRSARAHVDAVSVECEGYRKVSFE